MTTNVPQDVLEDAVAAGFYSNPHAHHGGIHVGGDVYITDRLMKFVQLRAQRQQGAEPDVVYVADYYGDSLIGKYDENEKLYFMPDGDGYTKEQLAEFDVQFFHSTPPKANALVAAAYRKAAKICMNRHASLHKGKMHSAATEAKKCASIILSAIPADAEAALREVSDKVAEAIKGAFKDEIASAKHFNLPGVADALEAFQDTVVTFAVNSILGEGGK
jgi:hypothetical protein